MRKIIKNRIIISSVVLVIAIVICIATFYKREKLLIGTNVWNVYFDGKVSDYASELYNDKEQSITIDDYTITLKESLYDSKTSIGYCIFTIIKENGNSEAEISKSNDIENAFGEYNRFDINVEAVSGQTKNYEFIDDTLYIYLSFGTEAEYDYTVDLIDFLETDESDIDEYKRYKFNINEKTISNEYTINDATNLFISPLGIVIDCTDKIDNVCISLGYKDGKEEIVVDTDNNIGIGNSNEYCKNNIIRRYQYEFTEIIDISSIDYIILNNEKYYSK